MKRKIYSFGFLISVSMIMPAAIVAQGTLQTSVYGDSAEKPEIRRKAVGKKTAGEARNLAATQAENARRMAAARAKKDLTMVTFVTEEPQSEIWLNDRMLGQTDGERKLTRKLVMGDYRVMVKKNNRILVPMQKITISESSNTFTLLPKDETKPPVAPPAAGVDIKNINSASSLGTAIGISAKVKQILDRYDDPATTDSVTPQDWELVYQAAQLGQFQDFTAVQTEAQRWFASGQIELSKGNYPNAFTAFTKSEEFMPQSGMPYLGLGNAYLANKQPGEALKAYQRAVQLSPKMAVAYRKLGDAQRISGKQKEAIVSYRSAIENGYKTPETRYLLASLLLESKRNEEGIKQLEEISKEWSKPEVFISIGDGYESMKRDVSAIAAYQQAIALDPKNAQAYFKVGNVYFDQHEFQKAKDAYQKAADLDPEGKDTNRADVQKKLREAASKIK